MHRISGAFHVTTFDVLEKIMERGLTQGGTALGMNESSQKMSRLGVYFSMFAPWDPRSMRGKDMIYKAKRMPGKRIVVYVPIQKLFAMCDTYMSVAGSILTFNEIPVDMFGAMWHEDYKGTWHRLMIHGGEKQLITQVSDPLFVADEKTLIRRVDECLMARNGDKDHYNFIKEMRGKIRDGEINLHPENDAWGDIVARLTFNHTSAGKILCPACLHETSPTLVICVRCQGTLASQGVRQWIVPEGSRNQSRRSTSPEREQDRMKIIKEMKDTVNAVIEVIDLEAQDESMVAEESEYVEEIEMEEPPTDYGKTKEALFDEKMKKISIDEAVDSEGKDSSKDDEKRPEWIGEIEDDDDLPVWAPPIPQGECTMPERGASNADTSQKAAEMIDVALYNCVKYAYRMFVKKMVELKRTSYMQVSRDTKIRQDQVPFGAKKK